MGWEVKNSGLHVVFAQSIPSIISKWLGPFMNEFLSEEHIASEQIKHFVAHPGGKKVLQSYEETLHLSTDQTSVSREILKKHGNMSSPTVLYVLEQFMMQDIPPDEHGLLVALGPGFCGEAVLLKWRD